MNYIVLFALSSVLLTAVSCSDISEKNRFFDIEKTNTEIYTLTGIDIFEFENKIEKDFDVYETFYDSIILNTTEENTNALFEKYGYYHVTTNGDTITINDHDSLILNLAKGFAAGIIQEECKGGRLSDSLCIVKMKYFNSLSSLTSPVGRVDNSMTDFIYRDLYSKDYLTKEEFKFMTLWWYVLSSIQAISDQEWHGNQKRKN